MDETGYFKQRLQLGISDMVNTKLGISDMVRHETGHFRNWAFPKVIV